ncbi:MAG TPA: flavin reductase family protein [Tepidisphaeraceae bacterium]|jgi:flavin reductase (DIM6/NTAB) family NADH-FMN oxidoreductase RutF|nr:flavin reductase family protein [Tepidisphaeraceae bacterium]
MTIDPATTPARDVYRHLVACITPRPIAWVSTISPGGITNLAPFSFFNGVGANPPAVVFSPVNRRDGSRKDTVINIEANRQFVVNIVSEATAERMNCTSAELPYEVSEFETCGLTPLASVRVKPPRVKEAAVQMECELIQIVPVGEGPLAANLVIGRIVMLHASDDVLDEQRQIDPQKLATIGRMGTDLYSRTRDRFAMKRPQ